jgi:hypothetical protein
MQNCNHVGACSILSASDMKLHLDYAHLFYNLIDAYMY